MTINYSKKRLVRSMFKNKNKRRNFSKGKEESTELYGLSDKIMEAIQKSHESNTFVSKFIQKLIKDYLALKRLIEKDRRKQIRESQKKGKAPPVKFEKCHDYSAKNDFYEFKGTLNVESYLVCKQCLDRFSNYTRFSEKKNFKEEPRSAQIQELMGEVKSMLGKLNQQQLDPLQVNWKFFDNFEIFMFDPEEKSSYRLKMKKSKDQENDLLVVLRFYFMMNFFKHNLQTTNRLADPKSQMSQYRLVEFTRGKMNVRCKFLKGLNNAQGNFNFLSPHFEFESRLQTRRKDQLDRLMNSLSGVIMIVFLLFHEEVYRYEEYYLGADEERDRNMLVVVNNTIVMMNILNNINLFFLDDFEFFGKVMFDTIFQIKFQNKSATSETSPVDSKVGRGPG